MHISRSPIPTQTSWSLWAALILSLIFIIGITLMLMRWVTNPGRYIEQHYRPLLPQRDHTHQPE
jgi:hypothetical protein